VDASAGTSSTGPGDEPSSTEADTTEPSTDEETEPPPERVALDDLLAAWEDAGFVSADGAVADAEAPIARSPIFVVVGGRPDSDDVNVTPFLVDMATDTVQLDEERSRTVVGDAALTDPSAPRSPLVDAVRERGDVWDGVTSVDDLEAFAGLAALTLGIDDLRIGRTGHYGVGEAADSLLPAEA
jgi:hypothetical protein